MFTPENEPHNNTWFYIDPLSMSAAAGLSPVQGYYLLAANKSPGGVPVGHQWRVDLPNNHLHYAITWFALAFGLLVIYIVYHKQAENRPD
jgi:surfeit locus 1 family protein